MNACQFRISMVLELTSVLSMAQLEWGKDMDGSMRSIDKLNLKQLGVEVVRAMDSSPGRGWIHCRGKLAEPEYPKD
jgi:hypothetical protein